MYEVEVMVGRKKRLFVVKRFDKNGENAERYAREALANWKTAKEAGLKVFPTYRIGDDNRSVLMTEGGGGEKRMFIASNNSNLLEAHGASSLLAGITDARKLFLDLFMEAVKAAEHNIAVHNDAVFFLVPENEPCPRVDFILGDTDCLKKEINRKSRDRRRMDNLVAFYGAIEFFIRNNIQRGQTEKLHAILNDVCREFDIVPVARPSDPNSALQN